MASGFTCPPAYPTPSTAPGDPSDSVLNIPTFFLSQAVSPGLFLLSYRPISFLLTIKSIHIYSAQKDCSTEETSGHHEKGTILRTCWGAQYLLILWMSQAQGPLSTHLFTWFLLLNACRIFVSQPLRYNWTITIHIYFSWMGCWILGSIIASHSEIFVYLVCFWSCAKID